MLRGRKIYPPKEKGEKKKKERKEEKQNKMVGKQGTAGAGVEGKRSSRLAAKEEACVVDSRKRGRASTGEDKKSSPAAVQPPPSKRGKAEQTAPAPAPEKAKNR